MDLNQWLALFLILVGIALIFYAIYGFKLARDRQKQWKELAKLFRDYLEKLKEPELPEPDPKDQEDNEL